MDLHSSAKLYKVPLSGYNTTASQVHLRSKMSAHASHGWSAFNPVTGAELDKPKCVRCGAKEGTEKGVKECTLPAQQGSKVTFDMQSFQPIIDAISVKYVGVRLWNAKKTITFQYTNNTKFVDLFSVVVQTFPKHGPKLRFYGLQEAHNWSIRREFSNTTGMHEVLEWIRLAPSLEGGVYVNLNEVSPKTSPNCAEEDDISTLSGTSKKTNKTRGTCQEDFHNRVLGRDRQHCVFCNDPGPFGLQAAHIFTVFSQKDVPRSAELLFSTYGIHTIYCTKNGITLCTECHSVFDASLCHVRVDTTTADPPSLILEAADAIMADPKYGPVWKGLNGRIIPVPDNQEAYDFPSDSLWAYRTQRFRDAKLARIQLTASKPFQCPVCGFHTSTFAGLKMHRASDKCLSLLADSRNRLTRLLTPAKEVQEPAPGLTSTNKKK